MIRFKAVAIGILFVSLYITGAFACDDGHWVQSVSSNGTIIKLEDGSVWLVDAFEAITSILWLPTDEIIVCGDQLINTDDGEKVDATKVK